MVEELCRTERQADLWTLFNDANFNRQRVDLLEDSFRSVRNPLEKTHFFETAAAVNH